MDAVSLMGGLLSQLHWTLNVAVCPGDWVWTTVVVGALIATAPIAGAMLVALVRRFVGNRYTPGAIGTFLVLGAGSTLILPWVSFTAVSGVFRAVAGRGTGPTGLAPADIATLGRNYCFLPSQTHLLGGGLSVTEALFGPSNTSAFFGLVAWVSFAGYIVTLGLLPLLGLFFVRWQARVAFRRGPMWPTWLFWLPFVLMVLFTGPLSANAVAVLWFGFLLASMVGVLAVRLIPAPSWSVINRPAEAPPPQHLEEPAGTPAPPADDPGLADDPGPLPATLAKRSPAPVAAVLPPRTLVASPVPPTQADPLGSFAGGRFRRVRQLGRGGFGQVWLAMDTSLGRMVAVKIAHAMDREAAQRMHREARALAALHHPNCVRVYDLVNDAQGLAIVMEYIEGDSLADMVHSRSRLDDIAAGRLWVTVAGALAAAHGAGVLHRDVKPANVIIDAAGLAHLIDFGIARSRGDSALTATGMMVGTPDFLAPEVARGGPATPASDSWQLAATVSFALTGQPPRGARETAASALLAAANGAASTHLPERSVHRRLLGAALDVDPARRPPLVVVLRELGTWLSRAGLRPDGPVTAVIDRHRSPTTPLPKRSGPPAG